MTARRDQEVCIIIVLLAVPMTSALLLFSCGSRVAAQQVTVQVPDDFTGVLRIKPCAVDGNLDKVVADQKGSAATSACPRNSEQIMLQIVRAGKTYSVSPQDIAIVRTGDGLPIEIRAQVPRQP